uniref:Uncharacterized protein n=1 Tax=Amphimedon queenslandica TaxID=400682 RepID=A0A1X7UQ92_AMPQE
MDKIVLLSYLDWNKEVKVPELKKENDIAFLEMEFRCHFNYQENVHLGVTFQRYNDTWTEYVDLDCDAKVSSMEKLKVIVSPVIKTPTNTSINPSVIERTPTSNDHPIKKRKRILDDFNCKEILPTQFTVSPSVSAFDEPLNSKKKINKTEDDSIPLPDPFPLPKHYRAEVEKALKLKQMSVSNMRHFLSFIASAVFAFKKYPSHKDYNCVARTIINQYPFLKAPTGAGTPHGAVVVELINRFKEFHRGRKARVSESSSSTSDKKADIIENGYVGVAEQFKEYPFLQNVFQKPHHFIDDAAVKWETKSEVLVKYASEVESVSNSKLRLLLCSLSETDENLFMISLLPESRCKSNHETIIRYLQMDECDITDEDVSNEVSKINVNSPYILSVDCSIYLITDCKVICSILTTRDIPIVLLSSYFVYNIEYPRGFAIVFTFLEVFLLDDWKCNELFWKNYGSKTLHTTPVIVKTYYVFVNPDGCKEPSFKIFSFRFAKDDKHGTVLYYRGDHKVSQKYKTLKKQTSALVRREFEKQEQSPSVVFKKQGSKLNPYTCMSPKTAPTTRVGKAKRKHCGTCKNCLTPNKTEERSGCSVSSPIDVDEIDEMSDHSGGKCEYVATSPFAPVKVSDFATVYKGQWLNEQVINYTLYFIFNEESTERLASVMDCLFCVPSYVSTKLMAGQADESLNSYFRNYDLRKARNYPSEETIEDLDEDNNNTDNLDECW